MFDERVFDEKSCIAVKIPFEQIAENNESTTPAHSTDISEQPHSKKPKLHQ